MSTGNIFGYQLRKRSKTQAKLFTFFIDKGLVLLLLADILKIHSYQPTDSICWLGVGGAYICSWRDTKITHTVKTTIETFRKRVCMHTSNQESVIKNQVPAAIHDANKMVCLRVIHVVHSIKRMILIEVLITRTKWYNFHNCILLRVT